MSQRPQTTEGPPAGRATRYVSGILIQDGASSERKIAMPKLIDTPNKSASAEVTSVPYTNGRAPKSRGGCGFQTVPPRKDQPKTLIDASASKKRRVAIRTRTPTTPSATRVENHRKRDSPRVSAETPRPTPRVHRKKCMRRTKRANRSSAMKSYAIVGDIPDRSLVQRHNGRRQGRVSQVGGVALPIVDAPPQEVDQRLRLHLRHGRPDGVQLLVDEEVREGRNRVARVARGIQDRHVEPITLGSRKCRCGRRCGRRRAQRWEEPLPRGVLDLRDLHRVLHRVRELHIAD